MQKSDEIAEVVCEQFSEWKNKKLLVQKLLVVTSDTILKCNVHFICFHLFHKFFFNLSEHFSKVATVFFN